MAKMNKQTAEVAGMAVGTAGAMFGVKLIMRAAFRAHDKSIQKKQIRENLSAIDKVVDEDKEEK